MGKVDIEAPNLSEIAEPNQIIPDNENGAVLLSLLSPSSTVEKDLQELENLSEDSQDKNEKWLKFKTTHKILLETTNAIINSKEY